jgi:hypothetical protein
VTRLRWKLNSVRLEIVGTLTQDRCIVCAEHATGSEIIFHPMELLGDVGHVESHFGPSRDSVSVGARWVHGLRQTSHWLKNHFGHIRWSDEAQVEARFSPFGDSGNLDAR